MTVRFKPLKCTIDVSVHGAFGVWSWAALTSRFIARGVRHLNYITFSVVSFHIHMHGSSFMLLQKCT